MGNRRKRYRVRDTKTRGRGGWRLPVLLLMLLSACATDGQVRPVPHNVKEAVVDGVHVTPLEEGRTGFLITENCALDTAARQVFEQAVALMQAGDDQQAIALLEGIIAQSPGVSAPYINLAVAFGRVGRFEQAKTQLETALKLVPGHPVASNEYGLLCRKTGQFDQARRMYEQAIAFSADYYPAHRNLGILCDLYLNDPVCALRHYELYSQARPEDAQVKLWIADLRSRTGSQ